MKTKFNRLLLALVVISFISTTISCGPLFYRPKKHFAKNKLDSPYDVIIVPGFPYEEGKEWSPVIKIRTVWADYLYEHGHTKNIIFSGSAVHSPFVESKVMAAYAEKLGVPKEHIFTEEKAEHTLENVYYSYRMAKALGFKKIAVASDFVQAKQLSRFIRKFDLPISMLPIVIDTLKTLEKAEPKIDVASLKVANFVPQSERQNLKKRFRGTRGKRIKWHKEDLKTERLRRKYKNNIIQE